MNGVWHKTQLLAVFALVLLVGIAMLSPPAATAEINTRGGMIITALYPTGGGGGGGGGIATTVRGEGDPGFAALTEPMAASEASFDCLKAKLMQMALGGHRTDRTTLTSASSDTATTDSITLTSTTATTDGQLAKKGHWTTTAAPAIESTTNAAALSIHLTAPGGRRDKTVIAGAGGNDENGIVTASPTAIAATSSRRQGEAVAAH